MSRQLTQEQTEELFQICKNHGVYHYDVQMEMVDHLASSIEEIWETEPEFNFGQAKRKPSINLGKVALLKFIANVKRVAKKVQSNTLEICIEFYRWPKVIMTFVLTIGIFLLFQLIEQTVYILLTYAFLLLAFLPVYYFIIYPKFKVKTDSWKSFLLLNYMNQIRNTFILVFQLPGICWNSFNWAGVESIHNTWILLGLSFLMVFLNVILYAHFFYIPLRIREHFIETYPEFVKQ